MQIIDNNIIDIIPGYEKIQAAERDLLRKWREPLLAEYSKQRAVYEEQRSDVQAHRKEFNKRLRLGIWLSSALLLLGLLVLPALILISELGDMRGPLFCFSPLLILGGVTGWAIIIVLWIIAKDQVEPEPPLNPLKSDLIHPLVPLWKEGLLGTLPGKKPHPDADGEYRFISRLIALNDPSYILYRIMPAENRYIDVVIIGSKGVWVFEVINLPGLVRWRDGRWSHFQPGGVIPRRGKAKFRSLELAFDKSWQESASTVADILSNYQEQQERNFDIKIPVRGGLVFAHPKGRYDIPAGCPFNWGVVSFWIEKLHNVPDLVGIDEYLTLEINQALLAKHHQFVNLGNHRSMIAYGDQLKMVVERNIQSWLENN
ncbi:MAG: NERD domain-containing protein [Chloroflexota bacterium]|nr:MAG: NERD domain-containing protein [Chloroflexota bacterium]